MTSPPRSNWFFGRYGFVLGNAFPLPLLQYKGALGFIRLDQATNEKVAAAILAREAAQ